MQTPSPTTSTFPPPSGRQTAWLIAMACLVWACSSWISGGNLDSYNDMLENYAWSQPFLWGTHKHPPFFAWVVGTWFTVFPNTDWAYRLLSYTNVAVGLWGVVSLGRRLGLGGLAHWGALLLLWSFPYTSLAGKFNANSQLLSLWPWAAALLLASWQEKGWRGVWFSTWLGIVAAACMLSKYYSGVFLAGFLLPIFLHRDGRQWLLTPRPYLALLVFALALSPHVAWMAGHDWAPIGYAMDQGGGDVVWRYVLRFTLSPLFYWLPAWLAVCAVYACLSARMQQQSCLRTFGSYLWRSWMPHGWDDVLYWLALTPWLLTLLCGMFGVAELSTPWAIPIGYAFALLWLRNLHTLAPSVTAQVLTKLRRAWWPVVALVAVLGLVVAIVNAQKSDKGYYRPTEDAAQQILKQWQERNPQQQLAWVGGDWAENAMIAFYAMPGLQTVPYMPDSFPAQLAGLGDWRSKNGLLLCPLGPVANNPDIPDTACMQEATQWLAAQGLTAAPQVLTMERSGWRFPKPVPFRYAVFDVPAASTASKEVQ
ncbi:glycosyltransferase family 39 protein [Comamonas kerstersii]|uniref:glycosyltransferase family 39 protein n=1 Tax=Comamonas kerstersii TaxID=225992 RepID=UPI003A8F02D4